MAGTLVGPNFFQNPYPLFAQLREQGPVRMTMYPGGPQAWVITRYADVRQILTDPRVQKDPRIAGDVLGTENSGPPQGTESPQDSGKIDPSAVLTRHMLNSDPPEHTRLRKLVARAFTARPTKLLRPRIEAVTEKLLARLEDDRRADKRIDLIESYALPMTTAAICEMLGIPEEDQEDFPSRYNTVTGLADPTEREQAAIELVEYLSGVVAAKRAHPGEDMISELAKLGEDDGTFTDVELLSMIFLLLGAGHESTLSLIGNAVLAMLERPEYLSAVHEDPDRAQGIVEETLRHDTSLYLSTFRYTTEPVEVGGVTIPARESVLAAMGAGNRDSAQFEDAETFDPERNTRGHLSFGHGIHHCLGAPLARLQSTIAVAALAERFPAMKLAIAPADLEYRASLFVRGLERLPVRL